MMSFLRNLAVAVVLACAGPAMADGVNPLYDMDGNYIGDVEIVGDVVDQTGTEYARLDVRSLRLTLYVDPDAVYVMLDPNNPIIRGQTPFSGFWIGWDPDPSGQWRRCDYGVYPDHTGRDHQLYGDLTWTNLRYSDHEDLVFAVDLGFCGDQITSWATNYAGAADTGHGAAGMDPWDLDHVRDVCGNASDLQERAVGCSRVIAHPEATVDDVTWGLWSRAYVRCGQSVPDTEIVADLMTAVRLDPYTWQEYFRNAGGYAGPLDGQISYELYEAVGRYVTGGCQ